MKGINKYKYLLKDGKSLTGFTLMELIVVIAITAILSAIILFTVTQYINKGKDSNIYGNMAILIPAGEAFYNGNGNTYDNTSNNPATSFCDPAVNSVMKNAFSQMPQNPNSINCYVNDETPADWSATSNPARSLL